MSAEVRGILSVLPDPVAFEATDVDRRWTFGADWQVGDDAAADAVAVSAGDLALTAWQRADPLGDAARLRPQGERGTGPSVRMWP